MRELLTEKWVIQSLLCLPVIVVLRKCRGLKQHCTKNINADIHTGKGQKQIKIQSQSKMLFLIDCKNDFWPFSHFRCPESGLFFNTEICQ